MRRRDREKPMPGWLARNKRGPGADHPDYRQVQLHELRERGDKLNYDQQQLTQRIEEAQQAGGPDTGGADTGEDTAKLENQLAELKERYQAIERQIQKFYQS